MLTVLSHVGGLIKTGDKHTIDNLDWSGEYIWESMSLLLLTDVLTHVNVYAFGTDILEDLILVIHASNF